VPRRRHLFNLRSAGNGGLDRSESDLVTAARIAVAGRSCLVAKGRVTAPRAGLDRHYGVDRDLSDWPQGSESQADVNAVRSLFPDFHRLVTLLFDHLEDPVCDALGQRA